MSNEPTLDDLKAEIKRLKHEIKRREEQARENRRSREADAAMDRALADPGFRAWEARKNRR